MAIGYDEPGVAYDSPLYTYDGVLFVPPDMRPRHVCARVGPRIWDASVDVTWFVGVQPVWSAQVREAVCR